MRDKRSEAGPLQVEPFALGYLKESQLIQETSDICDDLGAGDKFLPHKVVQYQVQVSLTIPCFLKQKQRAIRTGAAFCGGCSRRRASATSCRAYLVFEAEVKVRQHVQAGGQQRDLLGDDAQLALLGFPRIALNSNYVSPAQFVIDVNKFLL